MIAVGAVIVLAAGAGTAWLYWSRQHQAGPSGSVPSISAKVPAYLRDSGRLVVGVNIPDKLN